MINYSSYTYFRKKSSLHNRVIIKIYILVQQYAVQVFKPKLGMAQ